MYLLTASSDGKIHIQLIIVRYMRYHFLSFQIFQQLFLSPIYFADHLINLVCVVNPVVRFLLSPFVISLTYFALIQ